ncbi:MAG TPA: ABC transporter ATP-binding protein [Ktedonobacterales bacterium]
MSLAITSSGLTKRYGDVLALDHLDLEVQSGVIFGCLGPNGAGKTTLVRLLTGLARPTAGRATVAGFDVATGGALLHRHISTLDQQPQFYSWMSGRELLTFVGELYGMRGADLRKRVDEVLALTDLSAAARRSVGGYSGGMRQRLGLAQALLNQPDVLFLDEPVSALDPAGRHDILRIIEGLRGRATVFMSTHILADVERICDHVAILDKGRLVVSSTVADLQDRYAQPIFLLEPEPGQQERIASLITDLRQASWAGEVAEESGQIRIIARDTAAASNAILPLVAARGVALQRFERVRPSLEDIFLRLVGSPASQTQATAAEVA